MAKKLIIVWLSFTMVTFSSISIYAEDYTQGDFFIPRASLEDADSDIVAAEEEESRTSEVSEGTGEKNAVLALQKGIADMRTEKENYEKGLAAYIRSVNPRIDTETSGKYVTYFIDSAREFDLDEKLIMALAQTESTFNHDSVSSEDYKGMMQTGDGIARNAGYEAEDLFKPAVSIRVGARYLRYKLNEFGSRRLALTAYNQGSGSVNSGNYSTGFAERVIGYRSDIENFLEKEGYIG